MGIRVRSLVSAEFAVPVKAVLNNLGEHVPEDIEVWGITDVEWSDGTITKGVKHPGFVFYLEGAEKKILVDTGVGDFDLIRRIRNRRGDRYYLKDKPEWDITHQLGKIGVHPDDIEIVITTHLHWDHLGGNLLFKNARFYVQEDDVSLALSAPCYAPHFFDGMRHCLTGVADRLVVLDGNARIARGVEVWKVGGHTPGSQVVAVETEQGVVALVGDVIPKYDNWDYDWPGPAGNIWNISDVVKAHALVRRKADIMVPGHDWRVMSRYPDGVIG